jgi:hypothetical protein
MAISAMQQSSFTVSATIVCQLLMAAGADPFILNDDLISSMSLATASGLHDVIEIITPRGMK